MKSINQFLEEKVNETDQKTNRKRAITFINDIRSMSKRSNVVLNAFES
jgi:hypothetical protein